MTVSARYKKRITVGSMLYRNQSRKDARNQSSLVESIEVRKISSEGQKASSEGQKKLQKGGRPFQKHLREPVLHVDTQFSILMFLL